MPRNNSNKEKTIKSKMRAMTGDFWTIDNVSLYSNYLDIAMLPDGFILDDYRDHFEQYLEEIELDPKYYHSPSWFAYDYYGAAELDFLVLYFGNMSTIFDFHAKTIQVLPITALTDLNKLIVEYRDQVKNSKVNPVKYTKFDPIEFSKLQEMKAELVGSTLEEIQALAPANVLRPTTTTTTGPGIGTSTNISSIKSISQL